MAKRQEIVQRVRAIIAEYGTTRLTLRQIYYRLVAAQVILNRLSSYQQLSRILVEARKNGMIPWDAMEDRTRGIIDGYYTRFTLAIGARRWGFRIPEDVSERQAFEAFFDMLKALDEQYDMPKWYKQPKYVQVWLEKQALQSLFEEITDSEGVDLQVCRGYPSATFLREAADKLLDLDDSQSIEIVYFGDFDPSGADIERYVIETLREFGVNVAEFIRVAITREQIDEYDIPPAPAKESDARYASFVEREGVAWQVELDAIEPRTLQGLIRDSIRSRFSRSAGRRRTRELNARRERIRSWIGDAINDDFELPEREENEDEESDDDEDEAEEET